MSNIVTIQQCNTPYLLSLLNQAINNVNSLRCDVNNLKCKGNYDGGVTTNFTVSLPLVYNLQASVISLPNVSWNIITNRPTTLAGYGISDQVVSTTNSYSNPVWLQSLAASKITGLATVANTNNYNDLINKPAVPASQINADWTSTSGVSAILNKPLISTVGTTGSYTDLLNKPVIPSAQVQSDWNAVTGISSILNKPTFATVATTGSYNDLLNKPTIAGQINSDWNSTSGTSQILNKPTLSTVATTGSYPDLINKPVLSTVATTGNYNDLSNKPTIAGQINSDWNAVSGSAQILNKPTLAIVATSGLYSDLSGKPTIPAAQISSDWNASSGVSQILNKPILSTVATTGNYNDLSNKPTQLLFANGDSISTTNRNFNIDTYSFGFTNNKSNTNIGVISNPNSDTESTANVLGLKWVRTGATYVIGKSTPYAFEGISNTYNKQVSLQTIPFDGSRDFLDTNEIASFITGVQNDNFIGRLVAGNTKLVSINNEENNYTYYAISTNTVNRYGQLLAAISPLLHAQGILVTNGGLTSNSKSWVVWDWLRKNRTQADADRFAQGEFLPSDIPNLPTWNTSGQYVAKIALVQSYLSLYTNNPNIDYINFHYYAGENGLGSTTVDTFVIDSMVLAFSSITGKPAISNEIGSHTFSTTIVDQLIKEAKILNIPYLMWYDGTATTSGTTAVTLRTSSGVLNTLGTQFSTSNTTNLSTLFSLHNNGIYTNILGDGSSNYALDVDSTGRIVRKQIATVDNSTKVNTFNGRSGTVFPQAGDYSSITEILTNKTLTAPVINSPTGIIKSDVGLSNVDNTSDAAKPISTATSTALAGKEPSITVGTTSQFWRGDKTFVVLTQDNISDGTTNRSYTSTEKTKLAGISTGATLNSTDAYLLSRTNHTGTQIASTITGLAASATTDTTTTANITDTSTKRFTSDTEKTTWNGKQALLVSGNNIKTINGANILGSGDISVAGGSATTTDFIYASDYSIIGDGTTVNTTATVQAFFNAISSSGKVGIFAAGIYIINSDSTLEIKANSRIEGHGCTLKLNAGTTSTRYLVRIYPNKSNFYIKGITFDGNAANNTGSNISPFFIEDSVLNINFDDCKLIGSKDNAALTVKGGSTLATNSQINVVRCTFDTIGRSAIEFRGVKDSVVERCYFTNWGGQSGHNGDSPALQMQSIACTNVKIINNTFYNTLSTEFAIESGGSVGSGFILDSIIIDGNYFIDATSTTTSGGTGISGYFNNSTFINNRFIKGANNHHSGFEIFGSGNSINNNILQAGSIVVSTGSVINQDVSKNKITNNTVTCAASNGNAIIVAGYYNSSNTTTYTISDTDISGNYISTIGGSGNSSAIKLGTYATTGIAKEINIFDNTIYSSAYGIRLEMAAGSQDIYIRDNQYKQGNQFIAVINNNLLNVQAIDNRNESGNADVYNGVTPTNPVIFYTTVTAAEKVTYNGKQNLLVSGNNIKTINGQSITGSGDLTVTGGGVYSQNYYDAKVNGTVVGDGTTDDSAAITSAISASVAANKTLYFPAGTYLINSKIGMLAYLTIIGVPGKTIFKTTTGTQQYMFQSIGIGDITFKNITFTNNFSTNFLDSFLRFQSSPYQCKNINVIDCKFINSWVGNAIHFGNLSDNNSDWFFDNVLIDGCYIENLYGSQYGLQIPQEDSYYFHDGFCCGINLNQDVLRYTIRNTIIRSVSGDCIFQNGRGNQNVDIYKTHYMEGHIYNCDLYSGNMCIELNGGYGGVNMNVHDNRLFYPTREGGFAVSISCNNMNFHNNHVYTVERSAIEICTVTGSIVDNNIKVLSWKNSTMGLAPRIPPSQYGRSHFIELAGFVVDVSNNMCEADRSSPSANAPSQFSGIAINSINREAVICNQTCSYNGISDLSAYWNIRNNTLTGVTNRFVEATNDAIRNVIIENNNFIFTQLADYAIYVQGYNWVIKNNVFDLKLVSATPIPLVQCHTGKQPLTDNTKSVVTNNMILNDAYTIGNSSNIIYYDNKYQNNTTGLFYNMFPDPPMTQAQRTALTPKEGMRVYQTDGTKGTYTYSNAVWVAY